jgi:hypothetical protein
MLKLFEVQVPDGFEDAAFTDRNIAKILFDAFGKGTMFLVSDVTADAALVKEDYKKVRDALQGLVGQTTREELDRMEAFLATVDTPAADKAAALAAVRALKETMRG